MSVVHPKSPIGVILHLSEESLSVFTLEHVITSLLSFTPECLHAAITQRHVFWTWDPGRLSGLSALSSDLTDGKSTALRTRPLQILS